MNSYTERDGVRVGDVVTIIEHNEFSSGPIHVGAVGVVTEIRDACSPRATGPICFEVRVQGVNYTVKAYKVVKVASAGPTVTDAMDDDAIRRYAALDAARAALPADLPTEDYLAAAGWIHDGTLSFTVSGDEGNALPLDEAPESATVRRPSRPYAANYTNPDPQGDRLEYFVSRFSSAVDSTEMIFAVNTEDDGTGNPARYAALVNDHDLRSLRDFLTAVLEGE